MRFFTARRLVLAAVFPVLFSFSIIPGCSKQSEGDRCGDSSGPDPDSTDCDDGLVCTTIDPTAQIYRCCNPTRITNSRCVPVTSAAPGAAGNAGSGGTAGNAGVGGTAGNAGVGGDAGASDVGSAGASAGAGAEAGVAGDSSSVPEAGAGGH
jgi:hypothetical protein